MVQINEVRGFGQQPRLENIGNTDVLPCERAGAPASILVATLAQFFLGLVPSSPGGSGITWTEYTAAAALVANTGALINSTNDLEFTLPTTGLELGDRILISGKGTGIWSVVTPSGITTADGATNTGLRRLATHRFVLAELLWNGDRWIVANPADMTGLELFAPGGGGS